MVCAVNAGMTSAAGNRSWDCKQPCYTRLKSGQLKVGYDADFFRLTQNHQKQHMFGKQESW